MNDREQKALDALLSSKNYRDICPDTVKRVFEATQPGKAQSTPCARFSV